MPEATKWEDLSAQVAILKTERDNLAPKVERAHDLAEKADQAEAEIKIREQRIQELEARKVELEPLEERLARLEEQLAAKAEDLIDLETKISDKRKEAESCSEKLNTLGRELRHKQEELEKAQNIISKLIQEESEITSLLSKKQERLANLEQEIEGNSANLRHLKQQLSHQQSELDEIERKRNDARNQYYELRGKSKALEKEIESYQELIKTLKADYTAASGDQDDDESLVDLWEPIFQPWSTGGNTDEEARLSGVSKTLKHQGLIFPDRVVHAFHTSLKVADISPLVVLAGISGTGKSLLPRVYAETMGIHFLGLAVQPRWDSPQDMFGFYNYMERKYKATELSRSMVQFDLYPEKNWERKEQFNLSDQMLLVLLDEMNLARVEYYFSEFLSKLEVRRDINHQDTEKRRKVEISLDVGHGKDKDIRLFPGSNIVFAGTMNEDESTQSLSDKVLDRSCVLRFGKPNKILTKKPETKTGKSAEFLALSTKVWEKWRVKESTKNSVLVVQTINQLNDIMDSVGRPFGHRVGQAIDSYVANYPQWVKNSELKALSEQIEQRILPKLRGLDTGEFREAFEKLKELVGELKDDGLRKALEKGCEDRGGLGTKSFVWNGLDRTDEGLSS